MSLFFLVGKAASGVDGLSCDDFCRAEVNDDEGSRLPSRSRLRLAISSKCVERGGQADGVVGGDDQHMASVAQFMRVTPTTHH